MKTKISFIAFLIALSTNFLFAQHENDNWLFGNNKWNFNNTSPNGFAHTTNLSRYIRYISSVASDKNTGDLLFSSNGYTVYNKNNVVMQDGDHLFGPSNMNSLYQIRGNPSDQSSIIVPVPNSSTKYYVFFINGNRIANDDVTYLATASTNYGLGYAVVDLSFNGGLGKVTSKGMLFTNSATNALTSTIASDGNSYWIVTANNGNFLSYKLDASGLNTTPVVSPATASGNFFKISPNGKKLLTRVNKYPEMGVYLYDFNNTSGSITNQFNIIPNNLISNYMDAADFANSAEFSSDSNIVYFTISAGCLCGTANSESGMAMHNISTGQLVGYNPSLPGTFKFEYPFILKGVSATLQRAKNGKIYLIQSYKFKFVEVDKTELVVFGSTINGTYYSYDWGVINTPDVWNTSVNPVTTIVPQKGTLNGYSFPQLIPTSDNIVNLCPDVLYITTPVTSSQVFQAGKSIFASSTINDNLSVEYKAGSNVNLNPGFFVKGDLRGNFKAYINPCTITSFNKVGPSNIEPTFAKTSTIAASEVKIYPNPASTVVKIDSGKNKLMSWTLYDLSGKNILNGNDLSVPVENLPKSVYLLMIKLDNGSTVSKKIIVQ